jgi:hypothetical protein
MFLVLCSSSDRSGLWVYQGLRQLGVAVELVLSEWLAYGSQWEHRLDSNGTHLRIALPDGRVICSSRVRGAINRLLAPAPGVAQQAAASDRDYAQAELQAFYLSWLKGLPGMMINRPTSVGLCGSWYHTSEWTCRAYRAGLPVQPYRQSAHDAPERAYLSPAPEGAARLNLIAFHGQVFGGEVSDPIARACTKLALDAEAELLGIEMYGDRNGDWTFANATPYPDFSLGGQPLLESVAQNLTRTTN